jgi:hypothetical protein
MCGYNAAQAALRRVKRSDEAPVLEAESNPVGAETGS